jgi:hypothetical protein
VLGWPANAFFHTVMIRSAWLRRSSIPFLSKEKSKEHFQAFLAYLSSPGFECSVEVSRLMNEWLQIGDVFAAVSCRVTCAANLVS